MGNVEYYLSSTVEGDEASTFEGARIRCLHCGAEFIVIYPEKETEVHKCGWCNPNGLTRSECTVYVDKGRDGGLFVWSNTRTFRKEISS